jgi:hypothetical protein
MNELIWSTGEMILTGKNLGKKPVPASFCPPQTPHGLVLDSIQASAVKALF